MKKYYFLIIVALILGLVLTGCSLLSNVGQVPTTDQSGVAYLTKHTADDPDTTPLIAGQHEEVGTVSVWNDADNLYVEYKLNQVTIGDGWCLTETHVHVGEDLSDFPLNRGGNPKIGLFDYSYPHGCVSEYTYTIPITWDLCTELSIAAHAVVEEVTCFDGTSGLTIEGTEDLNIDGSITVEALVKVEFSETNKFYTIVGKWNDRDGNDRAWLLGIFNLRPCFYISTNGINFPRAIVDLGNELNIGQWYHLKGTFDGVTGEIEIYVDDILENTNDTSFVNININLEPVLVGGDRAGGDKKGAFFNGCIDEVNVWDGIEEGATLVLEWPETETAWADGPGFPGKNWATYFTYDLQRAAKMPLWNSTGETGVGYTCADGALKTVDGPYGFVILNIDCISNMLIVEFVLEGATANEEFKLYVNQVDVDGTCTIKSPNMVGELTTDDQGNGNAHFDLTHWVDADKFWVSAMQLPMPYYPIDGRLLLRSEAVVLDQTKQLGHNEGVPSEDKIGTPIFSLYHFKRRFQFIFQSI